MKPAVEQVKGTVVDYDPRRGVVKIEAPYDDFFTLCKREYKECIVQLIDSRPVSPKQRGACYALIREIAAWSGMQENEAKTMMKHEFVTSNPELTDGNLFSLGNASMSLVCQFQAFLIDFILSYDVPTKFPLIEKVDDIDRYIYACLVNKKCCVCGRPAVLHHYDRVGAGRNREEIVHVGMLAEPLCWEHHTECHEKPQSEFDEKYHICPVKIDKAIAKIYEVDNEQKRNDWNEIRESRGDQLCAER